jgi:hypothetical protein
MSYTPTSSSLHPAERLHVFRQHAEYERPCSRTEAERTRHFQNAQPTFLSTP